MRMITEVLVMITSRGELKNLTVSLSVYPWAPIMIKLAFLILICLYIINHFLVSLYFHFCETFILYNKAFRVVEYSPIPPFHRSIVPSFHRIASSCLAQRRCSLRKSSGSSEHLSLIEMVKITFFRIKKICLQSFHDV